MPAPAARVLEPISHSRSMEMLVAGAIIGGAVAVFAVVTAPVSVPVLIGAATIGGAAVGGAALGEFLGDLSPMRHWTGEVAPPCSGDVRINDRHAARAHLDGVRCDNHSGRPVIAQGSDSVFFNDMPAARVGDRTACDAVIEQGSPDVVIGGGTLTTDEISPEVPPWVHTTMFVVGTASAAILFGPTAAALGLVGGTLGGKAMHEVGGAVFGEGSDGQKILTFGGALAGGYGFGRGGAWFDRNYQVQSTGLGMNGGGMRITRRPPAARAADKGFPGIGTTPNGGPTFAGSDYLYPVGPGQRNVVNVEMTGGRYGDFKAANKAAGLDRTPDDYTWHHVDDYNPATNKSSLELVRRDAHRATYPHKGSVYQYEQATGRKYKD